jgi:hypothetical protein
VFFLCAKQQNGLLNRYENQTTLPCSKMIHAGVMNITLQWPFSKSEIQAKRWIAVGINQKIFISLALGRNDSWRGMGIYPMP